MSKEQAQLYGHNNGALMKAGQRALDNMNPGTSALELFKTPHRFGDGDAYVPPKRMAIKNKPFKSSGVKKSGGYRRKF